MNINEWTKTGRNISPVEWMKRIISIENPNIRLKIANIVYWDFFADNHPECRKLFDKIILQWDQLSEPTSAETLLALVRVGYPQNIAEQRVDEQKRMERLPIQIDDPQAEGKRITGVNSVYCSVVEQAINDVRILSQKGVIVNGGQIAKNWPPKKSNGVIGYSGRAEVAELINWMYSDELQKALNELNINRSAAEVLKAVGLNPRRKAA